MRKKDKRRADVKSSILVLLLIAILLMASTYAWFTANTRVTVSTLDVKVEAKNGLQISTNAVDWKSVISNEDITTNAYEGNVNAIPEIMEPVSTIGEVDTTTGYLKMYYGEVTSNETTGEFEIKATQVTETAGGAENKNNKFIAFDLFFKVDADTQLKMTTGSNVIPKVKADGLAGDDTGLKNAARVAFLKEGNAPAGSGVKTYTDLKGAQSLGVGETYFWEPNADAHTKPAEESGASFGIDTSATPVPYYGIKNAFTTAIDGTKITLKDAMKGTNTDNFVAVTSSYVTNETMTEKNIFRLTAGVTKIRIYMWIEGQDIDCENQASGSDISYNLQFEVAQ